MAAIVEALRRDTMIFGRTNILMCGRFSQTSSAKALLEHFHLLKDLLPLLEPRYNIAPTQNAAAVRLDPGRGRMLSFMRWGLIPSWSKDAGIGAKMINARAESVAEKPSFRSAFKERRCLIPGDGFYEWKKTARKKQPFYISMKDGLPFAFAGLWERWHAPEGKEVDTFTIITTEPNDLMRTIHSRMPVILHPKDYEAWLGPGIEDTQRLVQLLLPFPAEKMEVRPVSARVNSPKNDGPQCLESAPAAESEGGLLDFS